MGSLGSYPAITSRTFTASSTVRAMGPPMSLRRYRGMIPSRLVNAHGRANAYQATVRGRAPDGIAGVRPQSDSAEIGSYSRGRTSARACRNSFQIVGIPGRAGYGALGVQGAEGPFRHIGFGQYYSPGFPDFPDLEGIIRRNESLKGDEIRPLSADLWSHNYP